MNLLRVLLCSVLGLHPSDVPPKFKIPVKIGKCGNGRRNGVFYTSVSKQPVIAGALVSVNDLHAGLSSFVFRVKQITQNPLG